MKRIIIPVAVLIILSIIAVAFVILNNPPKRLSENEKTQALISLLGRKPNLTDDEQKGNKTYKSEFVSFTYPARAKIYTYQDPNIAKNDSVLETFSFDMKDPRIVFNYSVIAYKQISNISDIPDVKLRQLPDRGYVQEDAFADKRSGLSFERIDSSGNSEKTVFFLINGNSYSFYIGGNDIKEIRSLYKDIISSIIFL